MELGGIKKVETVRQNLPRDTIIWWLLLDQKIISLLKDMRKPGPYALKTHSAIL